MRLISLPFMLVFLSANAFFISRLSNVTSFQENSALEHSQLLLLLLCITLFLRLARRTSQKATRLLYACATLVSFTFLIRESDLRSFAVPELVTYFSDGAGRYLLLTPPWLLIATALVRQRHAVLDNVRQLLHSQSGRIFMVSAACLLTAILFDQGLIRMPPSRFYEELLEFNAYLFLCAGALGLATQARPLANTHK